MRLLTRLEYERNPGAIGYVIFRQSPKSSEAVSNKRNPRGDTAQPPASTAMADAFARSKR
jgi:hypothetical protein